MCIKQVLYLVYYSGIAITGMTDWMEKLKVRVTQTVAVMLKEQFLILYIRYHS